MATIAKRKHGYCVQIRRRGFAAVSRTFPTHSEAVAWANQEEAKRTVQKRGRKRQALDLRNITLREILSRYLKEVSSQKIGWLNEHYQLAALMRSPLCDLSLEELSVTDLAQYRDERLKIVKAGTVCRELGLVQHALNVATDEWGYNLEENPASKVRKPKLNNARNRRVSQNELDRLIAELAEIDRNDVISVIQFAVETGMRRGEILSLEWRFVDLHRRTAHLPRTKNGHARTVPLTNGAIAVLEKQSRKNSLVFAVSSDALKMCWRRIITKTGIKDLHFHDLRHEAISRFFEMGLSMPEVALISGHRDPRMLMRYTHLVPYKLAQKLAAM